MHRGHPPGTIPDSPLQSLVTVDATCLPAIDSSWWARRKRDGCRRCTTAQAPRQRTTIHDAAKRCDKISQDFAIGHIQQLWMVHPDGESWRRYTVTPLKGLKRSESHQRESGKALRLCRLSGDPPGSAIRASSDCLRHDTPTAGSRGRDTGEASTRWVRRAGASESKMRSHAPYVHLVAISIPWPAGSPSPRCTALTFLTIITPRHPG